MTETKTFKFGLDQFTDAGKALLKYAEQHPTEFGICCLGIAAGLVTIIVPLAMGFSAAGPVIGTVAAAWQASIGNVVAGSLFATLQSMTMSGVLLAAGVGMITVAVAGLAGAVEWAKGVDWAKSVDWTKGAEWAKWAEAAGLAGSMMEQWTKSVELATKEGWKQTEEGLKEGWKQTEDGVKFGWKQTEDGMKEGWKQTEDGMKEGWKRTEEGVKSVDWEGVGQGFQRAFAWG